MNNGLMFGTGGPMMSGTWYNPSTGDSFTVRDCFFENNQYVISTTDGRMLGYEVIQNYVQSDKPIEMPKKQQVETLPDEVLDILGGDNSTDLFVDNDIYGVPNLGNLNTQSSQLNPISVTSNTSIIAKALNKASKPVVSAEVVWKDFPKKQIEMLAEIMEIDTKEIVEWYASQLDTTQIAIAIHNSLISHINDQLYGKVEDKSGVIEVNDVDDHTYTQTSLVMDDTPKTPKKSTPKKTTKKTKK